MGGVKKSILTFSKAQVSSCVATFFDYSMTIVLAELCGVFYGIATFLGAVTGGVVNCMINYKWVFGKCGAKKRSIAMKYFVVWSVSIALNTLGTVALTEVAAVNFIYMKVVVSVAVALLWNYQMQRLYVFR